MAKKVESSVLGHDPLAWMNEETTVTESGQEANTSTANAPGETGATIAPDVVKNDFKVVLQATQNIQNVVKLRESIIQMLENSLGAIEIDASAVTSVDAATLQLFVALKREAERLEKSLVFDFPSERFVEAAGLLGLSEMMGLNNAASGFF